MSVDMGGPFNKAAYVFGTASIAAGNYDIMAAVMIGGMVPPCAIALATLLFKDKFTKEERQSGQLHYGSGIHHRGRDPVCSVRSAPRTACLHHRRRNFRRTFRDISMYFDGAPRRNLCIPSCWKRDDVSGSARDRNDCINRTPWITEKESCLKRFRWIKKNSFLRSKEKKTSHWMDIT